MFCFLYIYIVHLLNYETKEFHIDNLINFNLILLDFNVYSAWSYISRHFRYVFFNGQENLAAFPHLMVPPESFLNKNPLRVCDSERS